jgi:deoxyhypusine synthase
LLIAGLAGAGLAIAISWGRIKRLFKKNKQVDVDKDVAEDEDDEQPGA